MCHHYKGSRNPPEHLADEFSIRQNHYQLLIPDAGFYPLAQVPVIRLDANGARDGCRGVGLAAVLVEAKRQDD
jgi:hypothetical protein